LFPAGATAERVEGYVELLSGCDVRDLAVACESIAKNWPKEFMPPVSAIRDRVNDAATIRRQREPRPQQLPQGGATTSTKRYVAMSKYLRKKTGRFPRPEEVEEALEKVRKK
jgi:hypothetical protein